MKLLLVDDEELALEALEESVLAALPNAERHSFQIADSALAFAEENKIDIAFLDIDMPVISGLEMARKLMKINRNTNIIFVTGFAEYALDAFSLYASAYLTKPVTADAIAEALTHLRHPIAERRVRFHCFGNFEAYCDNAPIRFSRSRTKELLAYLVDRTGAECRRNEIIAALFEDDLNIEYYKKLRNDLIDTFAGLGAEDLIVASHGGLAINKDKVECDYYDYLAGERSEPPTEYMSQYSFAEETLARLQNVFQ